MANTASGDPFAWVRNMALATALAGGAWIVASAIGDLKVEMALVAAQLEHNAFLLERNGEALARNGEALARNGEALDEVNESLAELAEQLRALTRAQGSAPDAVARTSEKVPLSETEAAPAREHDDQRLPQRLEHLRESP